MQKQNYFAAIALVSWCFFTITTFASALPSNPAFQNETNRLGDNFSLNNLTMPMVDPCTIVYTGSIGPDDPLQTGRLLRNGNPSSCINSKGNPGLNDATVMRYYDSYSLTNAENSSICLTVTLSSCGNSLFHAAYLNSFNPSAPGQNYLADAGASAALTSYSFNLPANATAVFVVHAVNAGATCEAYTLTIEGICPPCIDVDEDGFLDATCGGDDCDDNNPNINPSTSPEQTNVIPHNPNSVTVYWSTISGSTNYMIRYRQVGSNTWTEATSLRAWRRLYSLLACTDYEVQFKNYKNGAWNCWSVSYPFTTNCAKSINPGGTKGSGDFEVGMEIFPNPTSDLLNIVLDENLLDKATTLTLRDQLGREIWSAKIQHLDTNLIQLNVREKGIANGVYTLSLQNADGVMTQQVVVSQ